MGKNLMRFSDLVGRDLAWLLGSCGVRVGFLARSVWIFAALTLFVSCSLAQDIRTFVPERAKVLAPTLVQVQLENWPGAPIPWTLAGQIEQESCPGLRHRFCWNTAAELKTAREYGFGIGQITTAYRPDGSVRFNKFEELKAEYAELRDWSWADRYRADYQLKALVLMVRDLHKRVRDAATPEDHWAFALVGYNGGAGSVLKDRLLCSNTSGCNPNVWAGNVERVSFKSRAVMPGYGRSPFEISREYPHAVFTRREKYQPFWS